MRLKVLNLLLSMKRALLILEMTDLTQVSVLDEMSGLTDDIFKEVGEELPEAMRLHKNYQEFRKTKAEGGIISLADGGRVGRWMGRSFVRG
jgi:hypothetical protein